MFILCYLLLEKLLYDPLLPNNSYHPLVDEARKLAKENTITYHNMNKVCYDACFLPVKLQFDDTVMYGEFHCSNTCKLSPPYSSPYTIVIQLSDGNFENDNPIHILKLIHKLSIHPS